MSAHLPANPLPSRRPLAARLQSAVWRGLAGAVLVGIIGWFAARLTIGMILARHLTLSQQLSAERLWLIACPVLGFLAGVATDFGRGKSSPVVSRDAGRIRCICWGAVGALTSLMLLVRVPLHFLPQARAFWLYLPGTRLRFGMEEAGLLSVPAALILGGILGWFFHGWRQRQRRRPVRIPDEAESSPQPPGDAS